jgi:hypothetical protein
LSISFDPPFMTMKSLMPRPFEFTFLKVHKLADTLSVALALQHPQHMCCIL